jgi:hypothetical protein
MLFLASRLFLRVPTSTARQERAPFLEQPRDYQPFHIWFTLLELGLVLFFVLGLLSRDFRTAFIGTCSFFMGLAASPINLVLLGLCWAYYRSESLQRARSRAQALRWASFWAIVGVILGGCLAATLRSLRPVNIQKTTSEALNAAADQYTTEFWIWVAFGALTGLACGIAMIWQARKAGGVSP